VFRLWVESKTDILREIGAEGERQRKRKKERKLDGQRERQDEATLGAQPGC
jgi:hypothetical protein